VRWAGGTVPGFGRDRGTASINVAPGAAAGDAAADRPGSTPDPEGRVAIPNGVEAVAGGSDHGSVSVLGDG
jgi:hypothetical protein